MVAIPDDMEYHGRGPMLSARRIDLNLLWRRAQQLLEASTQVHILPRGPKSCSQVLMRGLITLNHSLL